MTKRWTAYKIEIKDIVRGNYSNDGYVKYGELEVSRARVLGSVVSQMVSEDKKYGFFVIDDGTETIRIKSFEDSLALIEKTKIGDIVDVIGRLKKYNEELYIIPEAVQIITDPNWIVLRKLEIKKQKDELGIKKVAESSEENLPAEEEPVPDKTDVYTTGPKEKEYIAEEEVIEETVEDTPKSQTTLESPKDKLIRLIKSRDKGDGVEIEKLIIESCINKDIAENILNDMMNEGEIYEPRAGKIRLLK
ncbi:MAG TPA: hypothetical protein ENN30_02230 [Candidatus Woesearchaeota archaeon]|nr:hypothetical protein [Candidatus Woesearchaeota archaeon]